MAEATKVGSIFYEASLESKPFEQGAKQVSNGANDLKNKLNGLTPGIKSVGLALGAAFGASIVVGFFKESVAAADEFESSMLGLTTVARAFGQDIDATKQAAVELSADGLMPLTQSAEGLKNLLATGFTLPEAINLMNAFKDSAAFNRQGTLGFGEAIVGATQGLKNQNSIMVDNVGITKNLSNILEEAGYSQQDLGLVTSDSAVRQALYNGILREASIFQGDAGRAADTHAGQVARLNTAVTMFKTEVGQALTPALTYLTETLTGAAGGFNILIVPIKAVSVVLIAFISLIKQAGIMLGTLIGSAVATVRYGVDAGKAAFVGGMNDMMAEGDRATKAMTQVINSESGKQTQAVNDGFAKQAEGSSKKAQKIKKDLEEETEKFNDEMEKRNKRFDENLTDMIFAHLDKVAKLKSDLEDENKDFAQKMRERTDNFKQSMDEMKASHEERIAGLKDTLEEEKEANQEKTSELQASLDKELAKGKNASKTKIQMLQEEIAETNKAFEKKATDLQASMDQEDLKYQQQVAKATERDAAETLRMQQEHEKRVNDTQASLDKENAILTSHQDLVNAVKDKAREDDITRLVRQHNEENIEADKQHQKRMADIVTQGTSEGAAGAAAFNAEQFKGLEELKSTMDQGTKDMGAKILENMISSAKEAGSNWIKNFINSIREKAQQLQKFGGGAIPGLGAGINAMASLPQLATGMDNFPGGMALVGERGPEIVNLPSGSDVYSNEKSRKMVGGNVNVYIDKVRDYQDVQAITREIGFRAGITPG